MRFNKAMKDDRIKMCIASDNGQGKTGGIASLANAGWNVILFDFDEGYKIIDNYLTDEGRERMHYFGLGDDLEDPKKGGAWHKFLNLVVNGLKDEDEDLGKLTELDNSYVVVIDTLNFMSKAAIRAVLGGGGKSIDSQPTIADWGSATRWVEQKIGAFCSPAYKFHLIVNSHLQTIEDDIGRSRYYPKAVTKNQGTEIGVYFNDIYRIDVDMIGGKEKRIYRTTSDNKMSLKCSAPDKVASKEEFNLAKVFEKILGSQGN